MVNILRWIIALPVGFIALLLMHFFSIFAFGIAHGHEQVLMLKESMDMAGMPIRGSYILFMSGAASSAAFVAGAAWIVPNHKKKAAIILAVTMSVLAVLGAAFIFFTNIYKNFPNEFGVWYRIILEVASLITGSIVGAAISADFENVKEQK